jgi:hypothetical protein
MYAKIKNQNVIQYPYGYEELRADNPFTNFNGAILPDAFLGTEENLSGSFLEEVITEEAPQYDLRTQKIVFSDVPVFDGGKWIIKAQIVNKTTEEMDAEAVDQAKAVRADRDDRLAKTDWVVTKSLEAGAAVPQAMADYRQALRDAPAQAGFPWAVNWPVKPE